MQETVAERIKTIMTEMGENQNSFSKKIGVTPSTIATAFDRNKGVNTDLIQKITNVFTNISADWLITGEGEMLKHKCKCDIEEDYISYSHTNFKPCKEHSIEDQSDKNNTGETVIPLYDINAAAGLRLLFENGKQNIIDTIKIPYITKSDGAIFITGDSMYPLMKSGDIAVYKQVHSLDYLHYGDIYIVSYSVEGDEYVVIKYVQRSEKKDHLKLVSYNEHYNPVDIPISSVMAIAIVQANIRYNTMT